MSISDTKRAGRPQMEGQQRTYKVADDVHTWIKEHGGGAYLTTIIRAIMAVEKA